VNHQGAASAEGCFKASASSMAKRVFSRDGCIGPRQNNQENAHEDKEIEVHHVYAAFLALESLKYIRIRMYYIAFYLNI